MGFITPGNAIRGYQRSIHTVSIRPFFGWVILTSARAPLSRSVDDFSELLAVVSSGRVENSLMSWDLL